MFFFLPPETDAVLAFVNVYFVFHTFQFVAHCLLSLAFYFILLMCSLVKGCFYSAALYRHFFMQRCNSCANLIRFPIIAPKPWSWPKSCHAAPKCLTSLTIFSVALILPWWPPVVGVINQPKDPGAQTITLCSTSKISWPCCNSGRTQYTGDLRKSAVRFGRGC